ncbi:MAG: hypothetical protein ACR2H5_26875, partial [Ktedonobacteraceae bacterium]
FFVFSCLFPFPGFFFFSFSSESLLSSPPPPAHKRQDVIGNPHGTQKAGLDDKNPEKSLL